MSYLIVDDYNETHSKSILEYIFKKYISGQKSGTISLDDIYSILAIENNREEEYSQVELTVSDFSDLVRMSAYPQNQKLREKYQKTTDQGIKSAVLQEAYTQGDYIHLNIAPTSHTNYRIQLNTLNNRTSLAVMKALYAKPQIANSAKFYARSPQCNKPLKVDKVLIYLESKNQVEAVAGLLDNIEDLNTYNILPPFCTVAETSYKEIPFGIAYEEIPGESSFTIERSKDIFEYLTGMNENRTDIPHPIREELFSQYGKEPLGFVNSCFDYVCKKIIF